MKLEIVKLGINGEGIGYQHQQPIFVPGVFPEEIAEVEIEKKYQRYALGRVVQLVKSSPHRIAPTCKNRRCEACALKELDYMTQLKYKQQLIEEALYKYAGIRSSFVKPIVTNPCVHGYRNLLKLPVGGTTGQLVLGTFAPKSNRFIPIRDCVVQDANLNAMSEKVLTVLNEYRIAPYDARTEKGLRFLVLRGFENQYQITLIAGEHYENEDMINRLMAIEGLVSIYSSIVTEKQPRTLFGRNVKRLAGVKTIDFTVEKKQFRLSMTAFFQLNVAQAVRLYQKAAAYLTEKDTVAEAYCGVGAMTLFLSEKAKQVIGIENNVQAVSDAKRNAELNHITNCQFVAGDAAEQLKKLGKKTRLNSIVVDPPRSGLDETMIENLRMSKADKIIYVSCNPSTLAKNLKELEKEYQVKEVTPFDLFSDTPLIESVTLLVRR